MKLSYTAPKGLVHPLRLLGILVLVLTALVTQSTKSYADTLVVTSCLDDGSSGTLRSEVGTAFTGATITFGCSGTIALNTAISIDNKTLTIDGTGQSVVLSGGPASEIFATTASVNLTLNNLTLTGGNSSSGDGGAIVNNGTLTANNDTFTGNKAGGSGGAIANLGSLTVNNSTFSNNSASVNGGAIASSGPSSGAGALTITNSTFSGNTAGAHSGAVNGDEPPPPNNPTSLFTGDTFTGNSAADGGALGFGTNNPATIINSTFNANSACGDGAAIYTYAPITLSFSTVASNDVTNPSGGSAIGLNLIGQSAGLTLAGTILANKHNCDSLGGRSDNGSNLTFSGDHCGLDSLNSTDKFDQDPQLGALANNGGPTQTMALASTSPAVDGAASCFVGSTSLGSDQRGVLRPQGSACDIGAYELVPSCPATPSYGSGFPNANCLIVNQASVAGYSAPPNPAVANNVLNLTNNTGQDAGVYYTKQLDVTQPFSTTFDYSAASVGASLADGMTFIIQGQGPNALGCNGGDLGVAFPTTGGCGVTSVLGAITPSVAVEFDLLADSTGVSANNGCGSTAGEHVAIAVNGDVSDATNPAACYQFGSSNSPVTTAWIDYNGTKLNVYLAPQGNAKPAQPIITYNVSLPTALGANAAYAGFTAATGGSASAQGIQHWTLSTNPATPTFTVRQNGSYTWGGTTGNPLNLTGSATPNSSITLYSDGTCGTSLGTTTADATGAWSVGVTNAPSEGQYTYSAEASGNSATCSTPVTVNVDRTLPNSTVTSPALGTNPVYLNATGWAKTCDSAGLYNVCGTAGDTGGSGIAAVYVAVEGPNGAFWNGLLGEGSAYNTAGTWVLAKGTTAWGLRVPLPSDGIYTIASAAIDNAGNVQQIFQKSVTGLCTASKSGGSLSLNGGSLSINGGLCTIDGSTGATAPPVSGVLSFSGGSLSLNGGSLSLNGGSLSLNGGSVTVTSVTCTVTDPQGHTATYSASGTGAGGSLSLNGGSLSLNGGSLSLNGGSLSLNGGSLSLNGGSLSLNGGITPPTSTTPALLNGGTCTVTASDGSSGSLSLNGGSLSLNGGSLSLNGGSLSLNGGSLSLNGGSLSLNGGSLSLNGGSLSINGGAGGNAGNVVVDNVAPVVSSFSVDGQSGDGAQNVSPAATFHISFSKSMLPGTVNATSITVTASPGTSPTVTPTCDVTCQNASFSGFQPNTLYTVTVGSGATDLAGNALTGTATNPAVFHFTTATGNTLSGSALSDTDGDNIPDGWDGTSTLIGPSGAQTTTAAWGFSSQHKDLCLVENYMSGTAADGQYYDQHISQAANQAIVNAFANAPLSNPDGHTGVHLVIFEGLQYSAGLPAGYTGPYFGGPIGSSAPGDPSMVDPLGDASSGSFNWAAKTGTTPESFDDIRTKYFVPTGLSQFCHYALIAHTLYGSGSSGASRGINASDLVIALGGTVTGKGVGTQPEQQGTVMHELGHNLGLHHGGGPGISDLDINYKPNYMSVMNYFYQFEGVPGGFTSNGLDYSHGTMSPLNKAMLNLATGLGSGAAVPGGGVFGTRYFCPSGAQIVADATQPINWNCATGTSTSSGTVAADINNDGNTTSETLNDYNDWAHLSFNGGDIGYGSVPPPPTKTTIDISSTQGGGGANSVSTIEKQSVVPFVWSGFFSPLASDSTGTVINAGKAGKTYPVKFQLKDTTGNYVSTLTAVRSITVATSQVCAGGQTTSTTMLPTTSTAGLHYDSTANQYIYNWKTPATGCYMLFLNLSDGSTYRALFSLT